MKEFATWIVDKLNERDWRQADLARRAGLSTGALSNILNGNREPQAVTLVAIARALGEPPETLFRAAGILPPLPPADETLAELAGVAAQLNATERRRLVNVARLYLQEQRELSAQGAPVAVKKVGAARPQQNEQPPYDTIKETVAALSYGERLQLLQLIAAQVQPVPAPAGAPGVAPDPPATVATAPAIVGNAA